MDRFGRNLRHSKPGSYLLDRGHYAQHVRACDLATSASVHPRCISSASKAGYLSTPRFCGATRYRRSRPRLTWSTPATSRMIDVISDLRHRDDRPRSSFSDACRAPARQAVRCKGRCRGRVEPACSQRGRHSTDSLSRNVARVEIHHDHATVPGHQPQDIIVGMRG
jgi:hypothetical protein